MGPAARYFLLIALFSSPMLKVSWIFPTAFLFAVLGSGLVNREVFAAAPAAAPGQENEFDINEFRVLGNHVLAPEAIERAVYPFLGSHRTIETVKQAADALQKTYKDAGYGAVFVDIPEQDVNDGLVRLQVTEGRLEAVHIRGDRYFSNRQILAALPSLQQGKTPQLSDLQHEIGEVNARTADRTVAPVLKAGSEPGTLDVDLAVRDTLPLHGSVQYDNRHTADTTPNRATASLSYDNLWQRQDSVSVQYQTAPAHPSDAEVFMANYQGHIDSAGAQGLLSYTHTSSDVLALGTLGVLGRGSIYGAHWLQPLPSPSGSIQSLTAGADYKDVLTSVLPNAPATSGTGDTASPGSTSPSTPVTAKVKYVNWSAIYSGNWVRDMHAFSLTAGVAFGVRSGFNTSNEFLIARSNAYPNYFYVRVGYNGTEALPGGFGVLQRVNAQWADSPLVNNEQFSLGGADTVRGYLEAETLGDSGIAGTWELHSPAFGPHLGSFLMPTYAFVFVDGGVATLVDPLEGQRTNVSLWSTGVGLRLENSHGFTGSVDYAIPERTGVRTEKNQPRVDFLLRYAF